MGSIIARKYIQKYSGTLKGVILCGPVQIHEDRLQLVSNRLDFIIKQYGYMHVDLEAISLLFGNLNERFHPVKTGLEWLSRDEEEVKKKMEDPLLAQQITVGFMSALVSAYDIYNEEQIAKINKNTPILLIVGDHDPSTNYGAGPKLAQELYIKEGIKDVGLIMYPGARHELLNEINREDVTTDIIEWLDKHL